MRDEIRERLSGNPPEQLWWTWRFLELVLRDSAYGSHVSEADLAFGVDCFVRLAAADPAWATAKLAEGGPGGHAFASLLSDERLDAALSRIAVADAAEDAMLRARILLASTYLKKGSGEGRWSRAWTELQRVPEARHDESWSDAALSATAHADYPTYLQLADARLATPLDDFWRAAFLAKAIPTAAKHADWPTFARWLQQYRALPRSLRWDHNECAILNFEGLHALDEGRLEDAERIMEAVVELAPSLQFLSNDEVSLLAKRMRTEGRALGLCDRFDEITKERDWRLLKR